MKDGMDVVDASLTLVPMVLFREKHSDTNIGIFHAFRDRFCLSYTYVLESSLYVALVDVRSSIVLSSSDIGAYRPATLMERYLPLWEVCLYTISSTSTYTAWNKQACPIDQR